MLSPSRLLMASLAALATACGSAPTNTTATAELFAVNGASRPSVYPGDTTTWAGFGFGSEQGTGQVLVTADGLQPSEVVSWRDGEIVAVLPATVGSGPTYVLTAQDTLGPAELFVRPRTSYDATAHAWSGDATLPAALQGAAVGAVRFPDGNGLKSLLVLNGGRGDGAFSSVTLLGTVSSEGRVTAWAPAADTVIPTPRYLHAMVGADQFNSVVRDVESVAFMIGGIDSTGQVLADVIGLGVSGSGTYSLWTPMAPLPDRRAGHAALVAYDKIYAFGGFGSDSLATRGVAYATILPNGTLNGWFLGPPLPEGRAFAGAVAVGSTLLVLGGERDLVDPDAVTDTALLASTIYAIHISPLSGAFEDSVWTELPVTLRLPRSRFAVFVVDDALVVTGGVYPGMPSAAETEYATLQDGVPGAFQEFGGTPLATQAGGGVVSAAAPILWNAQGVPRVSLIGGRVGGVPTAQTWSQ